MSEGPARSGESEVALPRKGHFKRVRKGVEGQSPAIRQSGTCGLRGPEGPGPFRGTQGSQPTADPSLGGKPDAK